MSAPQQNLTGDAKYPIKMGKAPPRQKRDKGYNDVNARLAPGDVIGASGKTFAAANTYNGTDQHGYMMTNYGNYKALNAGNINPYGGQSMISQQMANRNRVGPQLAIERNVKFHTISNAKIAVASINHVAQTRDVQAAAQILQTAAQTFPLNKMRIPQMPDRFKIRKKFYDNNIEFGMEDPQAKGAIDSQYRVTKTNENLDYSNVVVVRAKRDEIAGQLNSLRDRLEKEMMTDIGMRQEYYNITPAAPQVTVNRDEMNTRGENALTDLMNIDPDRNWYKVTIKRDDIMGTEAITSSNAWYDENLYKKQMIGQSVKIGTPTYQIKGSEMPDLYDQIYAKYRVPMYAYVVVQYDQREVEKYRKAGNDALEWQSPMWTQEAKDIAKSQIDNAARNYVAVLAPQYKSLDEKIEELKEDAGVLYRNYNATAKSKGRMGMDSALSKMRFTEEAVKKTIDQIVQEYESVWKLVPKAKTQLQRPSWGQLKVKHADKLQSITIYFQDNHASDANKNRTKFNQIRISCNLKEVALTYKAVVSPWVRQLSMNHALMCQWKKNNNGVTTKAIDFTPTKIYGDRGQEMKLPQLMLSRPKYISFKKKKRNLYATWLTLGHWMSLANDPNTAAAMRFNSVINQDSYLIIRQLEGVLDTVIEAAGREPAPNPRELDHHAFHVLFARVVHKAEPGFKSAGIDGSRHAHFKLFDVGNTKGKYIRLNYANNAIGKKNVINLRSRLRNFLRYMKKLNSVNQIFQTRPTDRGFDLNMMIIAGNCVLLSMAAKFLPNHDFFTYLDNDDMVEQVKGTSVNTVMQMLSLISAQKKANQGGLGAYITNLCIVVEKMQQQAQETVHKSFAYDYLNQQQNADGSDAATNATENTNPMVAMAKIKLNINYQSGQYNNNAVLEANSYGQNQGLEESAALTINAVIRGKQLKQSVVAIIQKDLYLWQLNWIQSAMPGVDVISTIVMDETITRYDNALKRFGVVNFVGNAFKPRNPNNSGPLGPNEAPFPRYALGTTEFMMMIAYYRGFIEIMDSAAQMFTLYQLRVFKGATDEEFMAFLLYYLEISRQMIIKLIPKFTLMKFQFAWKCKMSGDQGALPVVTPEQLSNFNKAQLESTAFAGFEYRLVWGLQDMIGRIRQPSASGQPSMRTIGYRMTAGSFPDAPIANIAGESKYGDMQNVLVGGNKTLETYDGKSQIQPQKMGRAQRAAGIYSNEIKNNPRQTTQMAPYIQGNLAQADVNMQNQGSSLALGFVQD